MGAWRNSVNGRQEMSNSLELSIYAECADSKAPLNVVKAGY